MSFSDIVWFILISFAFIAYLLVLVHILADLFNNRGASGVAKAVWIVCLILLPFLAAAAYVITQGRGMAERQRAAATAVQERQDAYVKKVAQGETTPPESGAT